MRDRKHQLRPTRMLATLLDQTIAVAQGIWLEPWRQGRGLLFRALFPAVMMLLFGLVCAHNDGRRAGLDAMAAGVLMGAALFFSCPGGTVRGELAFLGVFCLLSMALGMSSYRHLLKLEKDA